MKDENLEEFKIELEAAAIRIAMYENGIKKERIFQRKKMREIVALEKAVKPLTKRRVGRPSKNEATTETIKMVSQNKKKKSKDKGKRKG